MGKYTKDQISRLRLCVDLIGEIIVNMDESQTMMMDCVFLDLASELEKETGEIITIDQFYD